MQNRPATFINYRRLDTLGHARALDEYLRQRFGNDRVFFDRSTIESGDVFPDTLRHGVEGCAVLLALIGPEWLDVRGDDGRRRLNAENDFVRQEIALALELGKKVIPVLFDDTPVPPRDRLPDPLKALANCDALTLRGKTYEYQTQRRELIRLLAKAPGMPPPLPEAEEAARADSNRDRMLVEVKRIWIDGYLKDSLHDFVRIELGLEKIPDAVSRPFDLIVQQPDRAPRPLPPGQAMGATFNELGEALLILGAPGAGKTTLLLELARDLLDRAVGDATHPIPVVFPLSTWAVQRRPLAGWLVDELTKHYHVPRKIAQAWSDAEQVLPLLDGLDEVAPEQRAACVEAINTFRRHHPLVPLAVCCRAEDYNALPERVVLSGAIVVQPLSRAQIGTYLKQAGKALAGVRTVLRDDETLWEMLETPLMLSIVALAYQGRSAAEVRATGSLEQRRTHLFENYTQRMFERRSKVTAYTPEQTLRWLTWLAQNMQRHGQTIFLIEQMQPTWLPTRVSRWQYTLIDRLGWGLGSGGLIGILGGLAAGRVQFGVILGLIVALVAGLFGGVDDIPSGTRWRNWRSVYSAGLGTLTLGGIIGVITGFAIDREAGVMLGAIAGLTGGFTGWLTGRPGTQPRCIAVVETMRWSWRKALQSSLTGMLVGLGAGLAVGFVLYFSIDPKLFDDYMAEVTAISGTDAAGIPLARLIPILFTMFMVGLVMLAYGALFGLVGGLVGDEVEVETKLRSNQGVWRSARWATLLGGSTTLIFGLVIGGIVARLDGEANTALFMGLLVGLSFGLAGGLAYGGYACLSHLALRLVLWYTGSLPWHLGRFLDSCSERIFLRKVGGGYIFVHRLLLEYFAALDPSQETQERASKYHTRAPRQ